MRRALLSKLFSVGLTLGLVGAAACSGSAGNNDLFRTGTSSSGGLDGAPPDPGDSSPPIDVDGGVVDTGVDAGSAVNEKPAPECHDLELAGDPVKATASVTLPPPQTDPLTSIAPGLYGVVSIVDYGGAVAQAGSSRTTVYFTSAKQYYISQDDSGGDPTRLTLSWKLAGGKLSRTILCGRSSGTSVEYRADNSPDGFTLYVPLQGGPGNRTSAIRYEKLD